MRPGMMGAAAKPRDFRGSFNRLLGELRPERPRIIVVMLLAIVGVAFSIAGPRILGAATNILFDGVVGKQLGRSSRPGLTQDQAVAAMRAAGLDQQADLISGMNVVPGVGVDFAALARVLALLVGRLPRSARSSPGPRPTSWPGSPSGPSTSCARRSTSSSAGCRSATSTATPAATR